ncbi:MAG TPA: SipW-dependent-type signal peptide-containing protein [Pseudolysinimonas sp.]|nr:SipW-dependent-type signal peptide-containing protein [Pseudolysinimonas sp.]
MTTGVTTSPRPRASLRVRAALAGGLVLGLGAGATVASWTDAASVTGAVTAGMLLLETRVGAGDFTPATTVAATVSGIYPGTTGAVYLPVVVRTAPTSVSGTVSFSHAATTAGGLSSVLRYRVIRSATCTSGAFSTGSPVWVVGGPASFPLVTTAQPAVAGPVLPAQGGGTAAYCVEFSVPTGLTQATYQGTSSTPVALTFTGAAG